MRDPGYVCIIRQVLPASRIDATAVERFTLTTEMATAVVENAGPPPTRCAELQSARNTDTQALDAIHTNPSRSHAFVETSWLRLPCAEFRLQHCSGTVVGSCVHRLPPRVTPHKAKVSPPPPQPATTGGERVYLYLYLRLRLRCDYEHKAAAIFDAFGHAKFLSDARENASSDTNGAHCRGG